MTIEEAILEKVRALPPEKQAEVLAVASSLVSDAGSKAPLRSPEGLWTEFDIDISEKHIAELRRETWSNFPREF